MNQRRRLVAVAVIAALVVVADQVTKDLAIEHLSNDPVHLLGPLSLVLAFNTGVAFSIGSGLGAPIIIIVLVVVALLAMFAAGVTSRVAAVGIGLVLGGAISNLGDRLFRARHGAVVDFIHTSFWPTFNLADASIVCGCVLLALVFLRHGTRRADAEASEMGERH